LLGIRIWILIVKVHLKQHLIDIADSIANMQGTGVDRQEFKDWNKFLKPLFYHVSDIVAYKLIVISNKSLSSFMQVKFLKKENWKEYMKDNNVTNAYENPIGLTQEFQIECADALPKEIESRNIQVTSESTIFLNSLKNINC